MREIDAAGGEANVVENAGHFETRNACPNVAVNLIHQGRGLHPRRAGLGAHMHPELPRTDRRRLTLS